MSTPIYRVAPVSAGWAVQVLASGRRARWETVALFADRHNAERAYAARIVETSTLR